MAGTIPTIPTTDSALVPLPLRRQAEFYLLGEDERYHPIIVGADNIFRSTVLEGFYLKSARFGSSRCPKWSLC